MPAPRLLPLGDAAWTVQLGTEIDVGTHARVMALARSLDCARAAGDLDGVIEWVPAFCSITVFFDPFAVDADRLAERLRTMARTAGDVAIRGRRWRIPVRFGGADGPDLVSVAMARRMAPEAVVALMTSCVFRVYLLGFMPGFPYMGGLPPELALPRRETPRTSVPARSLAITGQMCAIYPFVSPGGWHLLGRTPVILFRADDPDSPALLAPGDEVTLQAIDAERFARIEAEEAAGRFDRKQLMWHR